MLLTLASLYLMRFSFEDMVAGLTYNLIFTVKRIITAHYIVYTSDKGKFRNPEEWDLN